MPLMPASAVLMPLSPSDILALIVFDFLHL
jgi:hypothetical protein